MKKYNVRFYLHTYVEYAIEAKSKQEAVRIAEDMQFDLNEILENMTPTSKCDVEEI